jgi:hypothetical protein
MLSQRNRRYKGSCYKKNKHVIHANNYSAGEVSIMFGVVGATTRANVLLCSGQLRARMVAE